MARTPSMQVEVRVVSLLSPYVGDGLVEYQIDGLTHVGVLAREQFELRISNLTSLRFGYRISFDGRDIQTGREASLDPNSGSYFILSPRRTVRHSVWQESRQGGARFVFVEEGRSVATNTPGSLMARGFLSVIFFEEDFEETESWGAVDEDSPDGVVDLQKDYGLSWGEDSTQQNVASVSELEPSGVGAGAYRTEQVHSVLGLADPVYKDEYVSFRHLWWSVLLDKLNAANYQKPRVPSLAFPELPMGFVSRGADLRGVPREAHTVAYEGYPRTEPLNR